MSTPSDDQGSDLSSKASSFFQKLIQDMKAYALSHKKEACAGLIIGIGALATLFYTFLGAALVGFIAGFFLSSEIKTFGKQWAAFFSDSSQDRFRLWMFACISLTVFFGLPSLLLGALVGVGAHVLIEGM